MNAYPSLLTKIGIAISCVCLFGTSAFAHNQVGDRSEIANRRLKGQCRQVNRQISVYERPSKSSKRLLLLEMGYEVMLAEDEDLEGWVYINAPETGFVQTAYLTTCGTFQLPDTIARSMKRDLCINDQVSVESGLPIYTTKNPESTIIDRVFPGERVSVLGIPIVDFNTQVEWLQIDHPFAGWIINSAEVDDPDNTGSCE